MHNTQKAETYSQEFVNTLFQVFTEEIKEKGITLESIYSKQTIHQSTYYRWKNGQTPLSKSNIETLASILDISGDELEARTNCQMELNKKGIVSPQSDFNLRVAKITTIINHVENRNKEFEDTFFIFYRRWLREHLINDLNQPGNEMISNYYFPYHCLCQIAGVFGDKIDTTDKANKVNQFYNFTFVLVLFFLEFPNDNDVKKDMQKIITNHLKKATIPSSFKKWTELKALIELRNYYLDFKSVKHEVDSLDCVLRKCEYAIDCVKKSSLSFTHNEKKEVIYEFVAFAYYNFRSLSEAEGKKDLKTLFKNLFGFLLLSEKKQKNLISELFSFLYKNLDKTDNLKEEIQKLNVMI